MSKKIIIPVGIILALLILIIVVWVVIARGSDESEDTDPDAVLTQAMETALARMTETPSVVASMTSTWTALPSLTQLPTGSPTFTLVPTQLPPVGSSCDIAGFVADVTIPDGTEMAPGTKFTKIWELRNDGTCTWNSNYDAIFYSGAQMNGASPSLLTEGEVLPGQTVQIGIDMVAPTEQGRHIGNWVLRNDRGETFGIGGSGPFYVDVTVTGGVAATATATLTGVPTDTVAPNPTDTLPPAVTDTEAPKPSDTPVPTDTSVPTTYP